MRRIGDSAEDIERRIAKIGGAFDKLSEKSQRSVRELLERTAEVRRGFAETQARIDRALGRAPRGLNESIRGTGQLRDNLGGLSDVLSGLPGPLGRVGQGLGTVAATGLAIGGAVVAVELLTAAVGFQRDRVREAREAQDQLLRSTERWATANRSAADGIRSQRSELVGLLRDLRETEASAARLSRILPEATIFGGIVNLARRGGLLTDVSDNQSQQNAARERLFGLSDVGQAAVVEQQLAGLRELGTVLGGFTDVGNLASQISLYEQGLVSLVTNGVNPAQPGFEAMVDRLREMVAARDAETEAAKRAQAEIDRLVRGLNRFDQTRTQQVRLLDGTLSRTPVGNSPQAVQRLTGGDIDLLARFDFLSEPLESLSDEAFAAASALSGLPTVLDDVSGFFATNLDPTRILSGAAANLLSGGVTSLLGGVFGAAGDLFGESDGERRMREALEGNEEQLRRLNGNLLNLGDPFGAGVTGNQRAVIEDALDRFLDGNQRGLFDFDSAARLQTDLALAGLTFSDLSTIAKGFGIDLAATSESFAVFQAALEQDYFDQLRDDPLGLANLRADLLDLTPEQQREDLFRQLDTGLGDSSLGQLLDTAGFDKFIQEITAQITSGTFDATQLGDLTADVFLKLVQSIEGLDDELAGNTSAIDRQSAQLLNSPAVFRGVDAFRFLASDPRELPTIPPPEPTTPPAGTVPPSRPPSSPGSPGTGGGSGGGTEAPGTELFIAGDVHTTFVIKEDLDGPELVRRWTLEMRRQRASGVSNEVDLLVRSSPRVG